MSVTGTDVCLVGHPYMPIGMGEHIRGTYRALRSVAAQPALSDIYKLVAPETDELREFSGACTDRLAAINIFHINGNEVEQALAHLAHRGPLKGYNIIYPLWELSNYPADWACQLDRFDEIWAPSRFIYDSLSQACGKPVIHLSLACEPAVTLFLGRRYFGLPETDYTFLFFYDLRSYTTRKNPQAVARAFRKLLEQRPFAKTHLAIKVNGVESNPEEFKRLREELSDLKGHLTLFQQVMTSNEVKNLVRCCDSFVSLHRSEGYGFGTAEAMAFGKPVIATAYSGNMDFMALEASYGIGYRLVPVAEGEYPYASGQVWAEPDWEEAAACMIRLVDTPLEGINKGRLARSHMRQHFSYRAIGVRYIERLEAIRHGAA